MNIFDLDKNSLPEQVQINKENIATLMTDPTTKQYVDDQDAATLQSAKDYTDNHIVNAGHITSGASVAGKVLTSNGDSTTSWKNPTVDTIDAGTSTSGQVIASNGDGTASWQTPSTTITASDVDSEAATAGQVLTADGNGDAAWQTPSTPTITASDVDSETATAGQVLAADGNGGASWQTAGGGGGSTLVWSGSWTAAHNATGMPFRTYLTADKKYNFYGRVSGEPRDRNFIGSIVYTATASSVLMAQLISCDSTSSCIIRSALLNLYSDILNPASAIKI